VNEIVRLHLIKNFIASWASALGFSETTVPTLRYTVAGGFIGVVS
jgi:hypothetical protein